MVRNIFRLPPSYYSLYHLVNYVAVFSKDVVIGWYALHAIIDNNVVA